MFSEINMEEFNKATMEEREQLIHEYNLISAVTIEFKVESHSTIYEEHKYYEVLSNTKLFNDIVVSNVTLEETTLIINNEIITIKTNEEIKKELGISPYSTIYTIKVSKARYGEMMEL